mmetsp:Transcript_94630/g.267130  ORF Transcript_94630/g.267130 Transcript_94630/m.267130 type:complete len:240 (+) Transcript_94630:62-781(+)
MAGRAGAAPQCGGVHTRQRRVKLGARSNKAGRLRCNTLPTPPRTNSHDGRCGKSTKMTIDLSEAFRESKKLKLPPYRAAYHHQRWTAPASRRIHPTCTKGATSGPQTCLGQRWRRDPTRSSSTLGALYLVPPSCRRRMAACGATSLSPQIVRWIAASCCGASRRRKTSWKKLSARGSATLSLPRWIASGICGTRASAPITRASLSMANSTSSPVTRRGARWRIGFWTRDRSARRQPVGS